jgi:hypothetical protein
MLLDGKRDSKQLRLHHVGGEKKMLQLNSTDVKVVTVNLQALFDGPKGIWTVSLLAKAKGKADIEAKYRGVAVAKVAVTVLDKLVMPGAAGEEGLIVRLLLAENLAPGQPGYDAADSKKSMQWMRVVLANRLKNNPAQFAAPDAKNITDIVKAKQQFEGFEKYPTLNAKLSARINEIVQIANNDNDARQERYVQFLQDALDVAKGPLITDPCPTGLYGWKTDGSTPPGGRFEKYSAPLSGNQFYTLGKEK